MKTIRFAVVLMLLSMATGSIAQETTTGKKANREYYGHTLNGGIGLVYFGYVGYTVPAVHFNYEFDVARNFTLAPFITYFAYQEYTYWGSPLYPYRDYYYRESVMPLGVKGTYYFDRLLGAGPNWDFYLGASLGFAVTKTVWEEGYYGDRAVRRGSTGLYLDGHIGTEYHLSRKAGLVLDISSGISTLGLAVHL
jgi:hypothetical protein